MTIFATLRGATSNDDLDEDFEPHFGATSDDIAAFFSDASNNCPPETKVVSFPSGQPILLEEPEPAAVVTPEISIRALGVSGKTHYFVVCRGGKIDGSIVEISRAEFGENTLLTLAPLRYWEDRFGEENQKSGKITISWSAAKSALIEEAQSVGFYNPRRIRGRGTWLDKGRIVINTGDTLVVDGVARAFRDQADLDGFYSAGEGITINANAEPLDAQLGQRMIDVLERLNWAKKSSPHALAGWIIAALICGCLPWRPHAWLTGPKGSGKSTIESAIVARIMAQAGAVRVAGSSTEAGIRQMIGGDALPVLFDEAEGTDKSAVQRILKVLELARGSASADSAATAKGTSDGNGHAFQLKSAFFFASINTTLKDDADRSRVAVLELLPRPQAATDGEKATIQAEWNALRDEINAIFNDENGVALAARARVFSGQILKSSTVFRNEMSAAMGDGRAGDVWGTLAAARWHMTNDEAVEDSQVARAFLTEIGFIETAEVISGDDEKWCVDLLLSMPIDVSWIGTIISDNVARKLPRNERFQAGRLLEELLDDSKEEAFYTEAWKALADCGLKVATPIEGKFHLVHSGPRDNSYPDAVKAKKIVLLVAPRAPRIVDFFEKSDHAAIALNFGNMLARIGGRAKKGASVRFGALVAQPVWIPLNIG